MYYAEGVISGRLIREARLRAGMTQADLARQAGKATSMIGRWERGDVKPSLETTVELVRATGLELAFTITESDDHDLALIRRSLRQGFPERLAELTSTVRAFDAMATAAHG